MAAAAIDRLTARQLQVIALLAEGQRYSEVAARLSITTRQVQRHAVQAVERTGAANVCQLVALAIDARLI